MNGPTPILDSGTLFPKRRREIGAWASAAFGWSVLAFWALLIGQHANGSSNRGLGLVLFVTALALSILIHELGHLIAGWLVGFRFSYFTVGPVRLRLQDGKLKVSLVRERTALGDTGMRVDRVARLRRRLVFYGLGGTAANALSLPVAIMVANHTPYALTHPLAMSFAAQFTLISIVLAFVNVIPGPSGSVTDGSRIATLMSDRKRVRRYLALCAVRVQNQKGVRPKDWRQTWLKVACSVPDGSVDDFWGNWLAYQSASARSDKHEANAHLDICLRLSCLQTQDVRRRLMQEAAFFSAWFLHDLKLSNKWLAQVETRQPMLLLTRRLDIATQCSRKEFLQAWQTWENTLVHFQALPEIEAKRTLLGDWLDFGDQILTLNEAADPSIPAVKAHLTTLYGKLGVSNPVAQIRKRKVSLKPLTRWLTASALLSFLSFVVLAVLNGHRILRLLVLGVWSIGWLWIQKRYLLLQFETLRGPNSRWYLPWRWASFWIPENARIVVRDIAFVTPWYVEKLGLCKACHIFCREYEVATLKFREDGKWIELTTRLTSGTAKTLRMFTKRIGRMKGVLSERGIDVGPIQQDRQGTRYFEIQDPEGNFIEVVEEL